jgi:hypothetical protein
LAQSRSQLSNSERLVAPHYRMESLHCLQQLLQRIDAMATFDLADANAVMEEFIPIEIGMRKGDEHAEWAAHALINPAYIMVIWRTRKWRMRPPQHRLPNGTSPFYEKGRRAYLAYLRRRAALVDNEQAGSTSQEGSQ